jgi:hypothetical protein
VAGATRARAAISSTVVEKQPLLFSVVVGNLASCSFHRRAEYATDAHSTVERYPRGIGLQQALAKSQAEVGDDFQALSGQSRTDLESRMILLFGGALRSPFSFHR